MQGSIHSILHVGSGGVVVDAECRLSNGLPGIVIVGLGNKAVDEARERVRSAFASSGIAMPRKRITINLAPADIPKDSTSLDLCIAMAILNADSQPPIMQNQNAACAFIGELGLEGDIRSVRGVIGKVLAGKKHGIRTFFVPKANLQQALLVPGVTVYAPQTLRELVEGLKHAGKCVAHESDTCATPEIAVQSETWPFANIAGQSRAKRALTIAAAGGHNIFLSGPPGTGKSMLARALPSLLPPLAREEMLEITHLHSLTGFDYEQLVTARPFRAPHHSVSHVAMVGGGARLRPGEISLSHHGVLFLDEIPEFNRQTIEALRQPLEDRIITVTRAKDSVTYPANFILVATANPCPCGYFGTAHPCVCPAYRVMQYQQKISGPIIDRIDLWVEVEDVKHEQLLNPEGSGEQKQILEQIGTARKQQAKRSTLPTLNANMGNAAIRSSANVSPEGLTLLNQAAERLKLSARSYMRVIKVARTIADLEQSAQILGSHVGEALQYRAQTKRPLE